MKTHNDFTHTATMTGIWRAGEETQDWFLRPRLPDLRRLQATLLVYF